MKIRIVHKRYLDWDEKTRAKIDRLRFRDGWFSVWQRKEPEKLDTFVAFHRGQPIGACMVYGRDEEYEVEYEAGFYVHYKYRRKGVGGALMRRCAKYYTFQVYHHNNGVHKFFSSFKSRKMVR